MDTPLNKTNVHIRGGVIVPLQKPAVTTTQALVNILTTNYLNVLSKVFLAFVCRPDRLWLLNLCVLCLAQEYFELIASYA